MKLLYFQHFKGYSIISSMAILPSAATYLHTPLTAQRSSFCCSFIKKNVEHLPSQLTIIACIASDIIGRRETNYRFVQFPHTISISRIRYVCSYAYAPPMSQSANISNCTHSSYASRMRDETHMWNPYVPNKNSTHQHRLDVGHSDIAASDQLT